MSAPICPLGNAIVKNGGCIWASGRYSAYERDDLSGCSRTDDDYTAFTVGGRAPIAEGITLGFGFERGTGSSEKNGYGVHLSKPTPTCGKAA